MADTDSNDFQMYVETENRERSIQESISRRPFREIYPVVPL